MTHLRAGKSLEMWMDSKDNLCAARSVPLTRRCTERECLGARQTLAAEGMGRDKLESKTRRWMYMYCILHAEWASHRILHSIKAALQFLEIMLRLCPHADPTPQTDMHVHLVTSGSSAQLQHCT